MASHPVERRAIGLMMREAEWQGFIEPPTELRELIAAAPYSTEEIDRALSLLVTREGRTIGGTVVLADLDGRHVGRLVLAELIEWAETGEWMLTEKGRAMSRLLTEYAAPKYLWRSLLSDSDPPVVSTWR